MHTEAHSEKGLTFWISKAKNKTKKPRVTTDSPRKLQAKSVAKSDKLSTFVYTTPQVNHLPSESQSIGESPAEVIQSIGESPADSKTESLQSNNNTGLTETFENPTPKDSIPKSPFYYNT